MKLKEAARKWQFTPEVLDEDGLYGLTFFNDVFYLRASCCPGGFQNSIVVLKEAQQNL